MRRKAKNIISKEILTTREAAALLKVTPQTIKNYIYSGKLKAIQTPGGHHRVRRADLKSLGFAIKETDNSKENLSEDELLSAYKSLLENFNSIVESLSKALDTRDIISAGHSARVAELATSVGERMGFTEKVLRDLRLAALLHDVGKIGISESILGKPGRLTDQEYSLVKKHPEIGESIVSQAEGLQSIAPTIRHCHEHFDGGGYPDKASGTDIDLHARIIAVADAYDFLRSELPFRKGMTAKEALQEIKNLAGTQFDPEIVSVFARCIEDSTFLYH